jgi:hypothetical protein
LNGSDVIANCHANSAMLSSRAPGGSAEQRFGRAI